MLTKKEQRLRRSRQTRIRIASQGVARLTVNRTNLHIYASVISGDGGRVLATASTLARPSGICIPRASGCVARRLRTDRRFATTRRLSSHARASGSIRDCPDRAPGGRVQASGPERVSPARSPGRRSHRLVSRSGTLRQGRRLPRHREPVSHPMGRHVASTNRRVGRGLAPEVAGGRCVVSVARRDPIAPRRGDGRRRPGRARRHHLAAHSW